MTVGKVGKNRESQKTCLQREAFGVRAKIPGFSGFTSAKFETNVTVIKADGQGPQLFLLNTCRKKCSTLSNCKISILNF